MKEYLKESDEYSSQWGKWGTLNKEQRDLIKRLLREMDSADEVIKKQFFAIERLNNELEEFEKFQEEHKIMKQILIENNLWETLLNDDRFLEYLRK